MKGWFGSMRIFHTGDLDSTCWMQARVSWPGCFKYVFVEQYGLDFCLWGHILQKNIVSTQKRNLDFDTNFYLKIVCKI